MTLAKSKKFLQHLCIVFFSPRAKSLNKFPRRPRTIKFENTKLYPLKFNDSGCLMAEVSWE